MRMSRIARFGDECDEGALTDLPLKGQFFIEKRKIDFSAGPGTQKKLNFK
jgi:hypothetical protein